ncbi:MAG: hypothetical protein ABI846_09875 [Rudaea sp.]
MRTVCLFALLGGAACVHAAEKTHYLDLVNTAPDSIVSFAAAASGSGRFVEARLATLLGGGDGATIAIATAPGREGCLQDLRIGFANGRILIQKNFDVCRYRSYHTGRYLRGSAQTVVATVP